MAARKADFSHVSPANVSRATTAMPHRRGQDHGNVTLAWLRRVASRQRCELAASTIPIGDAIIVLRSNGPKATVYGVHGATAVVLLAADALLFT